MLKENKEIFAYGRYMINYLECEIEGVIYENTGI
jgi:hypothetical protein